MQAFKRTCRILLVGLCAFTLLSSSCSRNYYRARAKAARARAVAHDVHSSQQTLRSIAGEDVGPSVSFKDFRFEVSNGYEWTHWDGTYPAAWPRWLALPKHSYVVGKSGSLVPGEDDYWECVLLIKADGVKLERAITASVPIDPTKPEGYRMLDRDIAKAHHYYKNDAEGFDVTIDRYGYQRVDAGRELRLTFEYSSGYEGWTVLRVFNRRLIKFQPLQP